MALPDPASSSPVWRRSTFCTGYCLRRSCPLRQHGVRTGLRVPRWSNPQMLRLGMACLPAPQPWPENANVAIDSPSARQAGDAERVVEGGALGERSGLVLRAHLPQVVQQAGDAARVAEGDVGGDALGQRGDLLLRATGRSVVSSPASHRARRARCVTRAGGRVSRRSARRCPGPGIMMRTAVSRRGVPATWRGPGPRWHRGWRAWRGRGRPSRHCRLSARPRVGWPPRVGRPRR